MTQIRLLKLDTTDGRKAMLVNIAQITYVEKKPSSIADEPEPWIVIHLTDGNTVEARMDFETFFEGMKHLISEIDENTGV